MNPQNYLGISAGWKVFRKNGSQVSDLYFNLDASWVDVDHNPPIPEMVWLEAANLCGFHLFTSQEDAEKYAMRVGVVKVVRKVYYTHTHTIPQPVGDAKNNVVCADRIFYPGERDAQQVDFGNVPLTARPLPLLPLALPYKLVESWSTGHESNSLYEVYFEGYYLGNIRREDPGSPYPGSWRVGDGTYTSKELLQTSFGSWYGAAEALRIALGYIPNPAFSRIDTTEKVAKTAEETFSGVFITETATTTRQLVSKEGLEALPLIRFNACNDIKFVHSEGRNYIMVWRTNDGKFCGCVEYGPHQILGYPCSGEVRSASSPGYSGKVLFREKSITAAICALHSFPSVEARE